MCIPPSELETCHYINNNMTPTQSTFRKTPSGLTFQLVCVIQNIKSNDKVIATMILPAGGMFWKVGLMDIFLKG